MNLRLETLNVDDVECRQSFCCHGSLLQLNLNKYKSYVVKTDFLETAPVTEQSDKYI